MVYCDILQIALTYTVLYYLIDVIGMVYHPHSASIWLTHWVLKMFADNLLNAENIGMWLRFRV